MYCSIPTNVSFRRDDVVQPSCIISSPAISPFTIGNAFRRVSISTFHLLKSFDMDLDSSFAGSAVNRLSIGKGSWVKFLNIFPFHKQLGGDLFRVQRPKPRNLKVPIGVAGPIFSLCWFFGSRAWLLSGEVLLSRWSIFKVENMLTQNMSYMADHSGGSNAIYGSYKPAVQVAMQPPSAYRMGEGMPTNTHLMQPATAPCMNESALPEWTFAPYDSFDFPEAGKSAECRQGVVCRRRFAWWWQVWSRG